MRLFWSSEGERNQFCFEAPHFLSANRLESVVYHQNGSQAKWLRLRLKLKCTTKWHLGTWNQRRKNLRKISRAFNLSVTPEVPKSESPIESPIQSPIESPKHTNKHTNLDRQVAAFLHALYPKN